MMKQKAIILRGPSGVGKSSVAKLLVDELEGKLKRLAYLPVDVSIYPFMKTHKKISKKERADIMQENIELVLNNFLRRGFTVVLDGMFDRKYKNKSSLERSLNILKKYNVKTFVIELYAHLEIVHERVGERVKKNLNNWRNLKDTKKKYERFMKAFHKDAIIIETENKSPKKILKEILEKIK